MSDLVSRKYRIQLALDPKPFVGVYSGPAIEKPVITGGVNNVWDVQRVDGKYILTLEDSGRPLFLRDFNGQLIGSDKALPPLYWSIRPVGESYTIEVPSEFFPTSGWTVNNPEGQSAVYIKIIEIAQPNQLWNFLPA